MAFRVTQNLLDNVVMTNLNRNIQKLLDTQSKLSSGKQLTKPSDDPVGTASAIRLRSQISETGQLLRNIDSGTTQLNTTDNVLNDMNNLLMRAQELAIGQANVTADENTRAAVSKEVSALIDQFVAALNTRIGDRYIFAGTRTLDTPFVQSGSGVNYAGDSSETNVEIESGTTLSTNIPGSLLLPTAVDNLGGNSNLQAYVERNVPIEERSLSALNQGSGVDAGFIRITSSAGETVSVDLTDVRTLSDVAFRISNSLDRQGHRLSVSASVDATTNSLIITDTTTANDKLNGAVFKVEEFGKGIVARQLGILGEDTNGDGVIQGRSLNPLSLTTRLEDLHLGAGVELGKFNITDSTGNSAVVDISKAKTLEDVRTLINQAGTNLVALINTGGNGLLIQDGSAASARGTLQITESGIGTHTARDLGLITPEGGVEQNTFIGESLDPRITASTPIELLNRGQGFSLGTINVENGPIKGTVDLSRVSTIGGLVKTLNDSGLDLQARINDLGTGVDVTSKVGGRTLKISNGANNYTANLLEIQGSRDILVDPVKPLGDRSDLQTAIDGSTRLKDLNLGAGVGTGLMRITDSLGNSINIDVSNVNSIQGVVNLINGYGASGSKVINVEARISDDQRSLTLIDHNTPNTAIQNITQSGNLTSDFNSLAVGNAMVVNAYSAGTGSQSFARSADIVSTPQTGETVLTGVIETVNQANNEIFLRTQSGELRKINSLQPVQNLFSGQTLYLVGSEQVTGDFQARAVDLVTSTEAGEQQLSGVITSIDKVNSRATLRLDDGSLRTVDFITKHGLLKVEDIGGGHAANGLGIAGSSVVGSDRIQGNALNPRLREATQLSLLHGGTFVPGRINISNGNQDVVVDLSNAKSVGDVLTLINSSQANAVASINPAGTGISVVSRINGTTLMVKDIALKNPDGSDRKNTDGTTVFDSTASQLGLNGSADVLGNLLFLRNALDTNNQSDIQVTLGKFSEALGRILNQRTTTGARSNQMSTTKDRGTSKNLSNTNILSGIEDLDVVKAVSDLAAQENAFNAALGAASKIILPSLMDYL